MNGLWYKVEATHICGIYGHSGGVVCVVALQRGVQAVAAWMLKQFGSEGAKKAFDSALVQTAQEGAG